MPMVANVLLWPEFMLTFHHYSASERQKTTTKPNTLTYRSNSSTLHSTDSNLKRSHEPKQNNSHRHESWVNSQLTAKL